MSHVDITPDRRAGSANLFPAVLCNTPRQGALHPLEQHDLKWRGRTQMKVGAGVSNHKRPKTSAGFAWEVFGVHGPIVTNCLRAVVDLSVSPPACCHLISNSRVKIRRQCSKPGGPFPTSCSPDAGCPGSSRRLFARSSSRTFRRPASRLSACGSPGSGNGCC